MAQILPRRDIFEEIGQEFGKGFGNSAAEQYRNNKLGNGIERLLGEQSPLKQYAGLVKLPGGAEHASRVLPLIQQARGMQSLQNEAEPQLPNASQGAPIAAKSPIIEGGESPIKTSEGLLPEEEINRIYEGFSQKPTTQQVRKRAAQIALERGIYNDKEATEAAEHELLRDQGVQEEKRAKFRSSLEDEASRMMQIPGLENYQKQIGELTNKIIRNATAKIAGHGLNYETASKESSDSLQNISKALIAAKNVPGLSIMPGGPKEKTRIAHLKSPRKEFEKYGAEELYDDVAAASAGITPMKVASFLDPLKNEKIKKEINSMRHPFRTNVLNEKELNRIAEAIKPEDNILSIEHALRDKKLSIVEFREKILEPKYYKKLTEKQKRQLNKQAVNSIFDDLLFETL